MVRPAHPRGCAARALQRRRSLGVVLSPLFSITLRRPTGLHGCSSVSPKQRAWRPAKNCCAALRPVRYSRPDTRGPQPDSHQGDTPCLYRVRRTGAAATRGHRSAHRAGGRRDCAARAVVTRIFGDRACDDLFSQFEMQKVDGFGVCHVFDMHWKISTQPVFDSVLTYGEMLPRAQPVPALGPHAMTAGLVDALLLACIHPVMHHQNARASVVGL